MREKNKIRQPELSSDGKESLKCYFSLITREDNVCWVKASGFSMLPLFWPGCKVRINTDLKDLEIGQVVVFPDGGKLIAHRIIECALGAKMLLTKGDTLCFFDKPTEVESIVGVVDFVDYGKRHLWVGSDPEIAALSARLGEKFKKCFGWLPLRLRGICYCCIFLPTFVWIQLRRKFSR